VLVQLKRRDGGGFRGTLIGRADMPRYSARWRKMETRQARSLAAVFFGFRVPRI
jgi:hypothetical protein